MKTLTAVVLVAGLFATGCQDESAAKILGEATPKPTAAVIEPTTTAAYTEDDIDAVLSDEAKAGVFRDLMGDAGFREYDSVPAGMIEDLGNAVCNLARDSDNLEDFVGQMREYGELAGVTDDDELAGIVGGSLALFCVDESSRLGLPS